MGCFHMMLAFLCFFALDARAQEDTAQGTCVEAANAQHESLLQVVVQKTETRIAGEDEANDGRGISNDPDAYWNNNAIDTNGDIENVMPLLEAQKLDEAMLGVNQLISRKESFDSLPPMAPLLYPTLVEQHDANILEKLGGLTRDSQITLPGNIKIPYWQTLQYANRNMRTFLTRFVEGQVGKRYFDEMPPDERAIAWEMSSILRKILVTDCVKEFIEGDPKYPSEIGFNKFKGEPFSAAIFYKHIENDVRGSYMRLGEMKSACAYADGKGITFNNAKKFSEKDTMKFVGCYAHEQAHNMGYHHKDRAPGGIQSAVGKCYRKKAYNYITHDLAKTPDFEF